MRSVPSSHVRRSSFSALCHVIEYRGLVIFMVVFLVRFICIRNHRGKKEGHATPEIEHYLSFSILVYMDLYMKEPCEICPSNASSLRCMYIYYDATGTLSTLLP